MSTGFYGSVTPTQGINFAAATNTANVVTMSTNADFITSYTDGFTVSFIVDAASDGAVTFNVNGIGAVKLLKGSDNATQVTTELVANGCYMAMYSSALDAAAGAFVAMNL